MTRPNFLILSSALVLSLNACNQRPGAPGASVSNFTLTELKTPQGGPEWLKMKVVMERLEPTADTATKAFNKSDFRSGKFEDTVFKLEYGTYLLDLQFMDKGESVVYRACEDERSKKHEVNQPTFTVKIDVCEVKSSGAETPAGEVEIKPSADVSITPNLIGGTNSGDSGKAGDSAQISGNPFEGATVYVNPEYSKQVMSSVNRSPELATKMRKILSIPTAIWIDRKAKIPAIEKALADARKQQSSNGKKMLVPFVVYNLPGRDCAAKASAGELPATESGIQSYKQDYIDPIAKLFKEYKDLRIVAIIEPDSLPNLVTNADVKTCPTSTPYYKEGVAYAVTKLSLPNTALYLDIAHGGWLGWENNRRKAASVYAEVLKMAGGSKKIRGFASNVSNYSPTQIVGVDGNGPMEGSFYGYNPARDELTFAKLMADSMAEVGIENRHFLIDTSRNGQIVTRKTRGSWCNVDGAGIGRRPEVNPSVGIDAFVWVKPPGESDGISKAGEPRFDPDCAVSDAKMGAPQAGEWFHDAFEMLVKNAVPAL